MEIDSWCPYELAPFLSRGKEPREFNGVKGERLRTVKLRGQLSQGLLLPIPEWLSDGMVEGSDVTESLGIQKWERPMPAQLQGQMRGSFPSFLRRTDQERIQNMDGWVCWDDEYEVTTKLDGSSMTVYWHEGRMGVCSRNVDLKMDQVGNTFVDMATLLFHDCDFTGLAIQGELIGPGIQGNREAINEHQFHVFDIWCIDDQEYMTPEDRREFCHVMDILHVPVLHECAKLSDIGVGSIESCLRFAEGPSMNNPVREGVVFKRVDGKFSFKAINNVFLLGEK